MSASAATKKTEETQTEQINWGKVSGEAQDYQDIFPRIQWMHGSKKAKKIGGMAYTGGLFIPEDQFTEFEAEGWEPEVFVAENNEEIKGWYTKHARLSVIRMKWFWFDGNSYCHLLCTIKGESTKSLFSFQAKGVTKAMYLRNAFNDHRSRVVSIVNRNRPDNTPMMEPFGIWFMIQAGKHDVYVSKKEGAEQSAMTPPELYIPEGGVSEKYATGLYVGEETYLKGLDHYRDTEAWQNQIPKDNQNQFGNNQQTGNSGQDDYTPVQNNPIPDEPEEFQQYEEQNPIENQSEPANSSDDDEIPF